MVMLLPELEPCPEVEASWFSRFLFSWSNGLVSKGKEDSLTEESLWDINPKEKCHNSCPAFHQILEKDQSSYIAQSRSKQILQSTKPSTTPLSHPNGIIRHRKTENSSNKDKVDKASFLNDKVSHEHDGGVSDKKPEHCSLWTVVFKTFWKEFFHTQSLRFSEYAIGWIINPHFMGFLMSHTADSNSSMWVGVGLSMTLLLLLMTANLLSEHATWINQNLQMHIRSSLMTSVFKKAMNLRSKSRKNYSMGEITNYLSSDCDTITYHLTHINYVMFTPVHFLVVFYQLFYILGPAAWLGILVVAIIMPINIYVTVKMRSLYEEGSKCNDEKMKLLNEVLTGIKVLKLYAWEKCFGYKLDMFRNKELDVQRRILTARAFTVFSWNASPYLISVVMFCGYFYLNEDIILTAKSAFAVVALVNMLRFAINQSPEIVYDVIKASVSIKRLEKFLYEEEYEVVPVGNSYNDGAAIEMKNASFTWDMESETLKSIDLSIQRGSLTAVVGQVGSGKSSLVSAVLGQVEKVKGHIAIQGSIAYVAQQAWIQNDNLQNNILFGKPMDRRIYKRVIEACALQSDIEMLTAGDKTEIGERGINLSGGQKQRVSLARAVYNDADIYLLDDPLSAVDSHVGKHIFDNILGKKGLLKEKTRVLVTHNVRYLPEADNIIVMDGGRVMDTGSFLDLLNVDSDGVFFNVLKSYMAEYEDNMECFEELENMNCDFDEEIKHKLRRLESEEMAEEKMYKRQVSSQSSDMLSRQSSRQLSTSENIPRSEGKCIEEEEGKHISGKEKWNLFLQYSKAFGACHMLTIGIVFGLYYLLWVGANIWLVKWTEDPLFKNINDGNLKNVTLSKDDIWRTNMFYLSVYSGFGIIMTMCILTYAIIMMWGMINASRDLHQRLLMSILKSPMEFFDTTPVGRITNRFSKDISIIDDDLPYSLEFWFESVLNISVTLIAVIYSTPTVLALIIPLAYHYYELLKQHTQRSNILCDLESKTRSPIESHFTESVIGADTVRAYRAQDRFLVKLEERVDNYHRMMFYLLLNHRLLGVQILSVSNLVCAASSLIKSVFRGAQSAALIGLGMTYSMEIGGSMGWLVILQSDVETNLISVDRIIKYTNSPNEAEWRKSPSLTQNNWPINGKIEFRNYSLRYRQGLDLVLRQISFIVKGGEKVGVVGRTGAGKSSLMLSLFRLVEPAEGAILIDGVNIGTIGLHDLREKLAIIPQDPVLFTGTLRMNLDPQGLYTDEDIWTVLDHTHLRQFVESLPDRLQSDCGEGGTNFSVGQRQLFCLARTLLRKANILVLDEATAAVDMETDKLIQQTIRSEFKDCTVLTIAHRLNTVMDYDRILVLDHGEVVEYDTPDQLLQDKGVFHQMTVDAGLRTGTNGIGSRVVTKNSSPNNFTQ